MKKLLFSVITVLSVLYACSPTSQRALTKTLSKTENKFHDHIGFMLFDPKEGKTLIDFNSEKYFTPASNTKIFTLFACLSLLQDSIPALKYLVDGDSLIVWGTGDPTFMNRNVFDNGRVYNFLATGTNKLFYSPDNFFTTHFGPGWSWEDYTYYYSPERSSFPVYGNVFEVYKMNRTIGVRPSFFSPWVKTNDYIEMGKESKVIRMLESNHTIYYPGSKERKKNWDIPFRADTALISALLQDTLKRDVKIIHQPSSPSATFLYSVPVDSIYKVMMQDSDNFIAEQLLLVCASVLGDSLKPEIPISFIKKNYLHDLPDEPVWIDGSGLSRYNLFTPRSIVKLWDKIYRLIPEDRLFHILAVGGVSGTIRNYYQAERPYIFAKTGTMSNVHCLSGYLLTRKGKTLVFSFMNNNFTAPVREVRQMMEEVLHMIYDNY